MSCVHRYLQMSLSKQKEKERHHKYYLAHKEQMLKQCKEWDKKIKEEARQKLGGKCQRCGTKEKLQLHHKYYAKDSVRSTQHESGRPSVNRAKEALKHPERFSLLCLSCHNSIEPKRKKFVSLAGFEQISSEVKNMTKVQKATIGGIPYLDKKTVLEKGVKKVKIETEAELVDTEFEGKKSKKLECICSTQVLDPTRVTWQMNNTTMNFLIDKFGDDTKTWIGKEVEIAVKQAGSSSPGVYPKDCSLEKVY